MSRVNEERSSYQGSILANHRKSGFGKVSKQGTSLKFEEEKPERMIVIRSIGVIHNRRILQRFSFEKVFFGRARLEGLGVFLFLKRSV
jgi:hypothetical protein